MREKESVSVYLFIYWEAGCGGGGGGTVVLKKCLYWGGSAPRSNPFTFYVPFSTEKAPLSFTFYWQMEPLSHTYFETSHPF